MDICRTKFANGIVADFAIPARKSSRKVILICDGVPSVPSKKALMEFLAKKGFWAFHIRYRGTWESDGVFLKSPPHKDISDVIDALERDSFIDVWSGNECRIKPESVYLIGSSFGGAAVILASLDKRVAKAIAISPVVNWKISGRDEPHSKWLRIVKEGFGNVYRSGSGNWIKLLQSGAYNPEVHQNEIDGSKIYIIHAEDDRIVPVEEVLKFIKKTGAKLKLYKKGGHFSASVLLKKPALARKLLSFLKYRQR